MNKKINRIIIFSSYFYPYIGGIERYVHNFSSELAKSGIEVLLVVSNHSGINSSEKIDGFTLLRLPVFTSLSQRFPIFKLNRLFFEQLSIIKSFDADVYILNTRFFLTSLLGAL